MTYVYIPAGTATTTGDSANVLFYDASTGGNRIKNISAVATNGAPGTPVANGVVVIGASSGAYGPYIADTRAHKVYFEDTTGTRTLVATNYSPFRVGPTATAVTKNASTALAATPITFNGIASATYRVTTTFDVTATSGTPDAKVQWTLPSGATALSWKIPDVGVGAAGTAIAGVAGSADLVLGTLNGTTRVIIVTDIVVSTTAGACTLTFAQNTSDASNTVFATGATAVVDRVS